MDTAILAWLAAHRAPALDAVMLVLTMIGRGGLVWIALAGILALVDRRRAAGAWQVVLAVLLAWLLTDGVLKPLVHRPRPFIASSTLEVVGSHPSTYSFPSGHAAEAVAGAIALSNAWPTARVAIWTLAGLVAFSRCYLGVHYPTDVLAGALLGWLVGWFVVGGTAWRKLRA